MSCGYTEVKNEDDLNSFFDHINLQTLRCCVYAVSLPNR